MTRILTAALLLLALACGREKPDPAPACAALEERWEAGGHLELIDCRRLAGNWESTGAYTLQLEADLKVLDDTQIFGSAPLVHKSGPVGSGSQRPAGEIVTVREDIQLFETDHGWVVPES